MSMPIIISVEVLPENERQAASAITLALMTMRSTVEEFEAAVALYQNSSKFRGDDPASESIVRRWPHIAARVAALCVYDFWMATQSINQELLARCPSIRPMMDMDAKREAQAGFTESFPGAAKIRTAAAHPAEINSTPEKARHNSARISDFEEGFIGGHPDALVNVQSGIVNGRYTCTFGGAVLTFDLSKESVSALEDALRLWHKTFAPVDITTRQLARDRAKTSEPQPEDPSGHRSS